MWAKEFIFISEEIPQVGKNKVLPNPSPPFLHAFFPLPVFFEYFAPKTACFCVFIHVFLQIFPYFRAIIK
jgi:hypothetical protein